MRRFILCAALLTAGTTMADELSQGQQDVANSDRQGQKSQQRVENLDDRSQQLLAEYRQIQAETEQLALYNRQMEAIVSSQQDELASLARQISEIERTEQGVLPLMSRMVDSLEQFTALDTPFLPEERSTRIALLRDVLTRADVTTSEKFRRVLEAYQVEVDYGRNIEAYRARSGELSYDFLRIGRLALYRLSNDASQAWVWHQGINDWYPLDAAYLRDLNKALKVAQQTAAPEMLTLPLPTPTSLEQGGQS